MKKKGCEKQDRCPELHVELAMRKYWEEECGAYRRAFQNLVRWVFRDRGKISDMEDDE